MGFGRGEKRRICLCHLFAVRICIVLNSHIWSILWQPVFLTSSFIAVIFNHFMNSTNQSIINKSFIWIILYPVISNVDGIVTHWWRSVEDPSKITIDVPIRYTNLRFQRRIKELTTLKSSLYLLGWISFDVEIRRWLLWLSTFHHIARCDDDGWFGWGWSQTSFGLWSAAEQ
jgi:hypothetical protein